MTPKRSTNIDQIKSAFVKIKWFMEIHIRDKVVVTKSPYSDVPAGTIATVKAIRMNHLGPGKHLYYLNIPDHKSFWSWEIKKIET